METPVALVIITRNRRAEAVDAIDHARQQGRACRIVVVDNNSQDGTPAALAPFENDVTLVRLDRNIGAAARNIGIALSPEPYVALCDDDCRWSTGALDAAARTLDELPSLGVVSGRVIVEPHGRLDEVCEAMGRSPLGCVGATRVRRVLGFLAGASMVRRAAFFETCGFEPRFIIGGEEELLAIDLLRAGWDVGYAADVVVRHRPSKVRAPHRMRLVRQLRNELCVAWMRYPPGLAARRSAVTFAETWRRNVALRWMASTLTQLPWAVRNRALDDAVAQQLRILHRRAPQREAAAAMSLVVE